MNTLRHRPKMEGTMGKFKGVTRLVDADTHLFPMRQVDSSGGARELLRLESMRPKRGRLPPDHSRSFRSSDIGQ